MHQPDTQGVVAEMPALPALGTLGWYTNGDPGTGVPASVIDPHLHNAVIQELLNVLAAGGVTPDKATLDQVATSITNMIEARAVPIRSLPNTAPAGPATIGNWYRIYSAGGIDGRGHANILIANIFTTTPDALEIAWSRNHSWQSSIQLINNCSTTGNITAIRSVRNTSTNTFHLDVQAGEAFTEFLSATVLNDGAMGNQVLTPVNYTDVTSLPAGDAVNCELGLVRESTAIVQGYAFTGSNNAIQIARGGRTWRHNGVVSSTDISNSIESAGTINLNEATGDYVLITGTTNISTITLFVGIERTVLFAGALTLTHSANLILPGAANYVTEAGSVLRFRGEGSGVTRCVGVLTRTATQAEVNAGTEARYAVTPATLAGLMRSPWAQAVTDAGLDGASVHTLAITGLDINAHGGVYHFECNLVDRVGDGGSFVFYINALTTGGNYRRQVWYQSGIDSTILFQDDSVNGIATINASVPRVSLRGSIRLIDGALLVEVTSMRRITSGPFVERTMAVFTYNAADITNITSFTITAGSGNVLADTISWLRVYRP